MKNNTFELNYKVLYFLFVNLIISLIISANQYHSFHSSRQSILEYQGKNLERISNYIAQKLSYSDHKEIYDSYLKRKKDIEKSKVFKKVQDELNAVKKNFEIHDEVYTYFIHPYYPDKIIFLTMSGDKPFVGLAMDAKPWHLSAWKEKRSGHTNSIYSDAEGKWLSGFSPILKNDKAIAIVQIDHNANAEIDALFDKVIKRYLIYLGLSLIISNTFLFIFGFVFNQFLRDLTHKISRMTEGSTYIPLKKGLFKELNVIIDKFNVMEDLLKQEAQEKEVIISMPNENPNPVYKYSLETKEIIYSNHKEPIDIHENEYLKKKLNDYRDLEYINNRHSFKMNHHDSIHQVDFYLTPDNSSINIYSHDITSEERLLEKTKKLAEESFSTLKEKEIFMANMSHEIRTPLNAIVGHIQLMGQEKDKKSLKESIEVLKFSSEHLVNIVNDVLDLSKLEDGSITLQKHPVSFKKLIEDIAKSFKLQYESKGVEFIIDIKSIIDEKILSDSTRLKQVFYNLLSNSLKFTAEGRVVITIEQTKKSSSSIHTSVIVKDTGLGISSEALENIFTPYTQEDSSDTREFGGTGLGLSICNQILKMLGGKLEIESEKGKGTLVKFDFDSEINTDKTKEFITKVDETQALKGRKILLAEDNDINAKLILRFLKSWDLEADHVANGQVAVEKSRDLKYDLILMDLQMPIMTGSEAVDEIKKESLNIETPVIALTANIFSEIEKEKMDKFDGFMSKPILFDDLKLLIIEKLN